MNDPLEALMQLYSHQAAVENAHVANRPRGRNNVLSGEANIPSDGLAQATVDRGQFGVRSGVNIQLRNLVVRNSVEPTDVTETTIFVPLPKKAVLDSELGQMNASVVETNPSLASIFNLRGTRITFEERVYEASFRKPTGKFDEEGKEIWAAEPTSIYYYHITRIQGAGTSSNNGATAVAPAPVTTDDLDWISNFLTVEGDKYEALSVGNVLIKLKAAGVNTDNHEIAAAVASKSLRQFLADRTETTVTV